MDETPLLRVLQIEHDTNDARSIRERLEREGLACEWVEVGEGPQAEKALGRGPFDLVLSDYFTPGFDGATALFAVRRSYPDVPFVFVSDAIGEERAVQAIRDGATDYVSKDQIDKLAPVVKHVLHAAEESRRREKAETALRESEERFRLLFDSMLNGFAHCRIIYENGAPVDFVYLLVNDAFGRLTGLTDVVGRRVTEVIPGILGSDPARFDVYGRVATTGRPEKFERYLKQLGMWFSVSVYSPARGEFVMVFEEISDRKRAEDEQRRSGERICEARKAETVGKLAGGIAHEFNNLLSVIIGNAEFIADGLAQSDPRRKDAEEVIKAGRRGAELVRQLLAYSGKLVLSPGVLDLNELIRSMESPIRTIIGDKIDLVAKRGAGLWNVKADTSQIERVLMHLAANARDAMPGGGTLTMKTGNFESGKSQNVMLSVSDTGCGIERNVLAKIFDPFFSTKGVGKGTGLGLSTVQGIVRQSGGRIEVESEPGRGTTVRICFPRHQP